ncbi:hypothetical protein HSZ48_05520 [Staphylococcus saprophyticus]|uniref:hypothetical protein n=1 Tax=Staphylococcus saprophyticus TaxID=29385 RepID=UPI0015847B4B|nr:hypothetical protein [Staphylococcus saprophyticus]MCM3118974.1 hypothetical protein [Staphylococcus saprophyticus]QKV11132.1 hypothetical protein HSZ48_05520 [Staphylococcus saprophyticus]
MSYERTTKDSVEYIANKFAENPGHFAATILRMYWDVEKQRDQYKAERDTLIDDLSWYKAKVSRLERELKKKNMDADRLGYRWRNSHDEAKTYKSLLSEFSQHIGNKPSSSTYKYFRAKLDDIGIKVSVDNAYRN